MKSKQQVSKKQISGVQLSIYSPILKFEKKLLQLNQSQINKIIDAMCFAGTSKNIELDRFAIKGTVHEVFGYTII